MIFLAFLLALIAAVTSVGTLLLGMMLIFTDDPQSPVLIWGYALIFAAALMVLLGLVSAILVWARPSAGEKSLWLLFVASLSASVFVAVATSVAPFVGGPPAGTLAANIALAGVPALLALAAAILVRLRRRSAPAIAMA